MASRGISLFVECGAGNVLAGLVKRIASAARSVSIGIPADIDLYRAMA
jgi:[acyl-carrier-protein] S-malonyltransferase